MPRLIFTGLMLLLAWGFVPTVVLANTPAATRLEAALDELDEWLGDGRNGDRWRQFLLSRQLRAHLEKGSDADPAAVTVVLKKYRGKAKGLEMSRFAKVRLALQDWLAELKAAHRGDVSKMARAARGDHQPVTEAELAAARTKLRQRARALELAIGGNSQFAANWKQYLLWDALIPHFSDDHVVDRDALDNLAKVLRRLRSNEPGLELPVFTAVAEALDEFEPTLYWAMRAKTRRAEAVYNALLKNMSEQLERHLKTPTVETHWQIARTVAVLNDLGDSPALLQAVRRHSKQPNVFVTASSLLVSRQGQRPVTNTQPVRDCILGTSIFGCANTCGNVQFQLVPAYDHIEMLAVLSGCTASQTIGYHDPVKIGATGMTSFTSTKRLIFSHDQFMSTPASTSATTRTRINSIRKTGGQFGHRLVERIARRRAAETKPKSEYIAARHAEAKINRSFDEQVVQAVAEGRLNYETKALAPLIRRGIWPGYLRMHSESATLGVDATFATDRQLAASGPPPMLADGYDIAFRLHESAIGNYLPLALGGVTVKQTEVDEPPKIDGPAPPWLKKVATRPVVKAIDHVEEAVEETLERTAPEVANDYKDLKAEFNPWSITLNETAPVSVSFDDNKVAIRVRASSLVSDEQEYRNWDFAVTFRLEKSGNEIKLQRIGEIEVFPTGFDPQWDKKMAPQQASFRNTLAKNMNARAARGEGFPLEIPIRPLVLPNIGTLQLAELRSDNGWLTVAWRLP